MFTYGWDADILGGILETPRVTDGDGVSFLKSRYRWREPSFLLQMPTATQHYHGHNSLHILPYVLDKPRANGKIGV